MVQTNPGHKCIFKFLEKQKAYQVGLKICFVICMSQTSIINTPTKIFLTSRAYFEIIWKQGKIHYKSY